MQKRTIRFGEYDTAAHGLWTMSGLAFPEPPLMENFVDVPGRYKGPLDMSTALTDGIPTYGSRELSVTLESSEGDRAAREARISDMVNRLNGKVVHIVHPDHPRHYAVGRLKIQTLYSDLAHSAVQVTGTCEPWLYADDETVLLLQATNEAQTIRIRNSGVMPVQPLISVGGESVSFSLRYGEKNWVLSEGEYMLPDMLLTPGYHEITFSGTGTARITYREAVIR